MEMPHIRIFPHSQKEFPSIDLLMMWLQTTLRARGGVYHLKSADSVKDLPPGSIILFRCHNMIVGEAVISKDKEVFPEPINERTLLGEPEHYEAQVVFHPSSIRLYSPSLPIKILQNLIGESKDIVKYPGGYYQLDCSLYPQILAAVVASGGFLS
jgi:hypothetical protein